MQKIIAADFVFDHPFAEYMRDSIDASTSLVEQGTRMIFVVIGAGGLAREIFSTSAETNIFVTRDKNGALVQSCVECHIFDGDTGFAGSLDDGYYRCRNALAAIGDVSEYLPLPEYPTIDKYHSERIGSADFFSAVIDALELSGAGKIKRFVAVCTDDGRENVEIARKISELLSVRQVRSAAELFVCNDGALDIGDFVSLLGTGDGLRFAERAAKVRHTMYALENVENATEDEAALIDKRAAEAFDSMSEFERGLNVYACLSLRSKLLMSGFDLSEKRRGVALSADKYRSLFDPTMEELDPTKPFDTRSRRNIMAVQEHFRWNAHMLVCGFVPADIKTIVNETAERDGKTVNTNGKSFERRRHGNLTTFDGLTEFARLVSERDNIPIETADVIKYDFMIMDGACRIAERCGCYITKSNLRRR